MEILEKDEAIARIMAFIRPPFTDWYVGITSKPLHRVFQDHKVPLKSKSHTCIKCSTAYIAWEIERFFLEELKTSGGPRGDDTSVFVYAFKRTTDTKPAL